MRLSVTDVTLSEVTINSRQTNVTDLLIGTIIMPTLATLVHSSSSRARPSDRTIRASRRRVTCSRVLPRGRSGINVSNWRIEALACARVAHVLQRAADSGLPAGYSSCPFAKLSLFRLRLQFFLFAERRGRAIVSSSKSSRTREKGLVPGPDISCAHMQITVSRCNHASIWWSTIIRTILLRRLVNRRIARAFAFTQPAYRVRCCFPPKTVDRWNAFY